MSNILDHLVWHLKARRWVSALGDEDGDVRKAAAKALGEFGNTRAVGPLITVLGDENSDVRRTVAEALGRLGDARAVEPLITTLDNEDMREAAAEALVQIGTSAVEPLFAALRNENSSVRRTASDALRRLGDTRAVSPLIAALQDQDSRVRSTAAAALDTLEWEPQTDEQRVAYWIAKEDWNRCAAIGEPAIEPLLDLVDPHGNLLPPPDARGRIQRVLAHRFGSHPAVAKALHEISPRVLVAEDEEQTRELIGFTLRFAGFDAVLAADGAEALEKASLKQPDLILLDISMPKVSGYEVCRRLKENPDTCAIRVVFMSAHNHEADVQRGLNAGAVGYIVKPFSPDELTNQIKDILRRVELGIYEED